ncbi:MAG: RNA polymerase sigma factor [Gemmataceae bacterium]
MPKVLSKRLPRRDQSKLAPRAAAARNDPDVQLMLRVQRDEAGAFAELVRRFWSRIFGRLYRLVGDRHEAEDLAQDVFLRLYRSRKRYQPTARFTTWLFLITQNVARNGLRTRRRHPVVPLSEWDRNETRRDSGQPPEPTCREAPSVPLERAELAYLVRLAVADLAERQRLALELHQFEERTYQEVAEELDMSLEAAKSLLYRARNQLRETLTPQLLAD